MSIRRFREPGSDKAIAERLFHMKTRKKRIIALREDAFILRTPRSFTFHLQVKITLKVDPFLLISLC